MLPKFCEAQSISTSHQIIEMKSADCDREHPSPAAPLRLGRTRLSGPSIADLASGQMLVLVVEFLGPSMRAARALRLIDHNFKQAVAASTWADLVTRITGSVANWSLSFPRAVAANLSGRHDLTEADFSRHFTRLRELDLTGCESPCVLDGAFVLHCVLVHLNLEYVFARTPCY